MDSKVVHAMYGFDENNPQYRCCCSCCHVKTGAIIIGVLELIYTVYEICVNAWTLATHLPDDKVVLSVVCIRLGINAIFFFAILLMFISIPSVNHNLVWPHLIMQFIFVIYLLFLIIMAIYAIIKRHDPNIQHAISDSNDQQEVDSANSVLVYAICIIAIATIYMLLQGWWIMVIRNLQRYLKDKRYIKTIMQNNAAVYGYGMQPPGMGGYVY